jgi:hypothetical protein
MMKDLEVEEATNANANTNIVDRPSLRNDAIGRESVNLKAIPVQRIAKKSVV